MVTMDKQHDDDCVHMMHSHSHVPFLQVLAPQKGVKEELARAANDKFYAYSRIQHRVQWVMMEREKMQREADAREKERRMLHMGLTFAFMVVIDAQSYGPHVHKPTMNSFIAVEELQIDWHDFTVVETIPNTEFERLDLPPPVNV